MNTYQYTDDLISDQNASHPDTDSDRVANRQLNGVVRCAPTQHCISDRPEVRVARTTDAQRRTNAAWLRSQLTELHGWIAGAPHRWPTWRVAVALEWILAGDDGWRLRAADALRGGGQ